MSDKMLEDKKVNNYLQAILEIKKTLIKLKIKKVVSKKNIPVVGELKKTLQKIRNNPDKASELLESALKKNAT